MIQRIEVMSRAEMLFRHSSILCSGSSRVISVHGRESLGPVIQANEKSLILEFDDEAPNYYVINGVKLFDSGHAANVCDFLCPLISSKDNYNLYVNCFAGLSRSGAIGEFARRCASIEADYFLEINPLIYPNSHVLNLLCEEANIRNWHMLDPIDYDARVQVFLS